MMCPFLYKRYSVVFQKSAKGINKIYKKLNILKIVCYNKTKYFWEKVGLYEYLFFRQVP